MISGNSRRQWSVTSVLIDQLISDQQRAVVSGQWSVISIQWSVTQRSCGQWSTVPFTRLVSRLSASRGRQAVSGQWHIRSPVKPVFFNKCLIVERNGPGVTGNQYGSLNRVDTGQTRQLPSQTTKTASRQTVSNISQMTPIYPSMHKQFPTMH